MIGEQATVPAEAQITDDEMQENKGDVKHFDHDTSAQQLVDLIAQGQIQAAEIIIKELDPESLALLEADVKKSREESENSSDLPEIDSSENSRNTPEKLTELANYLGSWFSLQGERMSSEDFRKKFKKFLMDHLRSLKAGEPRTALEKPQDYRGHYQLQLNNFPTNLERAYSVVQYGPSGEMGGKSAGSLGHGKIGEPATLYSDGTNPDGTPLTARQKDIIAGHEAYHGMVDAQGSAQAHIKSGFDWDAYNAVVDEKGVKQPSYLRNPDELTARMAQFKNYFGMKGGEQFSADHLQYIRDHYVEDTGLDNGVSLMLELVTPATETQFLQLMNELPL